jgi:hypothetical protein
MTNRKRLSSASPPAFRAAAFSVRLTLLAKLAGSLSFAFRDRLMCSFRAGQFCVNQPYWYATIPIHLSACKRRELNVTLPFPDCMKRLGQPLTSGPSRSRASPFGNGCFVSGRGPFSVVKWDFSLNGCAGPGCCDSHTRRGIRLVCRICGAIWRRALTRLFWGDIFLGQMLTILPTRRFCRMHYYDCIQLTTPSVPGEGWNRLGQ